MGMVEWSSILGNIGEFVGSIAVLATLLYLAMQIRQNTRGMRAQTYHNFGWGSQAVIGSVADDRDLTGLMMRGLAGPEAKAERRCARGPAPLRRLA